MALYVFLIATIALKSVAHHAPPTEFEQGETHQPVADALPISLGVYVNRLWGVDILHRSFYADFYLWIQGADNSDEFIDFQFMNQAENEISIIDETDDEARHVNGQFYRTYRVVGKFLFDIDLTQYPFDHQTFPVIIESSSNTIEYIHYRFDPNSRLEAMHTIGDWKMMTAAVGTSHHSYRSTFSDPFADGNNETYSQLTLQVTGQREALPYILKTIVPLILILLVSNLIFFIHPKQIDSRVAICVTTFFAAIGLQITAGAALPNVGYLTIIDTMFIIAYGFIALATLQMVWSSRMVEGREGLAILSNRLCGVFFPVTFTVLVHIILP
ncbi:MAG: hypothetical protein V7744_03950 [Pseudomonadales bacterium]